MLRISDQTRTRIQDGIKKYSRIVHQARQRGMNERDTADIVKAMLGDMLGYDPFFDVTAESSIRGPHADHAVLLNGRLQFLLLVKAVGIVPHAAHLLRLSGANTPNYCQWALLSNADYWACYRLGVGPDRHPELVFRVSLSDAVSLEEKTTYFLLVSREGMEQNALEYYWQRVHALNPGRIASLLLSEDILNLLRRELMRTANFRVERQVLLDVLQQEVIRPEALAAQSAAQATPNVPQCYAYVANPNDASTWKLAYRNPDGVADPDMLMAAASQLTSDTRQLDIPADDVPLVKQRLRQAYLELGIPIEDIPAALLTGAKSS